MAVPVIVKCFMKLWSIGTKFGSNNHSSPNKLSKYSIQTTMLKSQLLYSLRTKTPTNQQLQFLDSILLLHIHHNIPGNTHTETKNTRGHETTGVQLLWQALPRAG